jgi:hypothetical protein
MTILIEMGGVCPTSLGSFYIHLKIKNKILQDPAIFSTETKILNLLYVVFIFLCKKKSRFHGKTARYYVLKIKLVDILHHRYKLQRDNE